MSGIWVDERALAQLMLAITRAIGKLQETEEAEELREAVVALRPSLVDGPPRLESVRTT